jgi:NADH-ubiquinone oxidoreductase chain 5
MVVACGISQYSISLFHLINHAFFKALLFLSAGAVLHAILDEQDMRKMGNLILFLPITYISILIGSLSLMAFPFLTGFYSKDFLLEILLIPYNFTHTIAYFLTLFAAFLTSIYSIRLLILTFISKPHWNLSSILYIKDNLNLPNILPLIILNIGAIFFGYLTHELFLGIGSTFYLNNIFIHPDHIRLFDGNLSQPSLLKYLTLLPLLFLFYLLPIQLKKNYINNSIKVTINKTQNNHVPLFWMSRILNHMNIFNHWIMHNFLNYSIYIYRYWDKGLLQIAGPQGIYKLINFISFK